jgi:hypothetical protein
VYYSRSTIKGPGTLEGVVDDEGYRPHWDSPVPEMPLAVVTVVEGGVTIKGAAGVETEYSLQHKAPAVLPCMDMSQRVLGTGIKFVRWAKAAQQPKGLMEACL